MRRASRRGSSSSALPRPLPRAARSAAHAREPAMMKSSRAEASAVTEPSAVARSRSIRVAVMTAPQEAPSGRLLLVERLRDRIGEAVPCARVASEGEHPLVEGGVCVGGIEQPLAERQQLMPAVDERGLEQAIAIGEVPVERAGADACATRDVVERGVRAVLCERLARDAHDRLVVASRIGAHGPRRCGCLHAHSEPPAGRSLDHSRRTVDKAETISVSW